MPAPDELPPELLRLALQNPLELPDQGWCSGVDALKSLEASGGSQNGDPKRRARSGLVRCRAGARAAKSPQAYPARAPADNQARTSDAPRLNGR
jgi:hypothetical protein